MKNQQRNAMSKQALFENISNVQVSADVDLKDSVPWLRCSNSLSNSEIVVAKIKIFQELDKSGCLEKKTNA